MTDDLFGVTTASQGAARNTEAVILAALTDAADHGRRCPTNEELGALLDFGLSAPPGIMARLERQGLITVERYQRERRVTIVSTGKATAQVNTPALHWRDRPRDVPAPPAHVVRERRPDTARDIMAAAQRNGRMPADFLADLVWLGWQHWQDDAIQAGASEGMV